MSGETDLANLKRVTFFAGQRLTATDLNDARLSQQELRWLHNRSLHNWGIGLGLGVTGEKGDRQVTVSPGYGTDHLGREIVLTAPHIQPIPPVAGAAGGGESSYYLTARYADETDLEPIETRLGVCSQNDRGAVRFPEQPRFAWHTAEQISPGMELILAQIWVLNCQLSRPVSLAPQRHARPPQQPHIGAGRTTVGHTAWELWLGEPIFGANESNVLGVKTWVDTSPARFRRTPNYQAHVVGDRVILNGTEIFHADPRIALIEGFPRVQNPSATGFELQVLLLPRNDPGEGALNPETYFFANTRTKLPTVLRSHLQWHVVWLGVEG